MTLPPEALKKLFNSRLKRGSILRTPVHFAETGDTKPKYLVVVSADHRQADPLLFFITSSQLAFYDKHPELKKEVVFLEPGVVAFFPKKTVINCREVHRFSRSDVEELVGQRRLKVVGDLPVEIMQQIDTLVAASTRISVADKKMILGHE